MERITFKTKENDPYHNGRAYVTCDVRDCLSLTCEADAPCEKMQEVIDTLFDIQNILGDDYDLDRLRELVEADRDGRCVVLPCKVGDTVYLLNHHLGRIFENEVSNFLVGYESDNKNTINTVYIGKYGSKTFRKWKFQQVGKTVFLTREAAEAAMKASDRE